MDSKINPAGSVELIPLNMAAITSPTMPFRPVPKLTRSQLGLTSPNVLAIGQYKLLFFGWGGGKQRGSLGAARLLPHPALLGDGAPRLFGGPVFTGILVVFVCCLLVLIDPRSLQFFERSVNASDYWSTSEKVKNYSILEVAYISKYLHGISMK